VAKSLRTPAVEYSPKVDWIHLVHTSMIGSTIIFHHFFTTLFDGGESMRPAKSFLALAVPILDLDFSDEHLFPLLVAYRFNNHAAKIVAASLYR